MAKKLYIVSEEEFKELFKLDKDYSIPKATLKQYSQYVAGSYLLYKELTALKSKKPINITFRGKREQIIRYTYKERGWQAFVNPLGDRMMAECKYMDKNQNRSVPFWTYTKFNDDVKAVASIAYNSFENELLKLQSKYSSKYQITLQWRNMFKRYGDLDGPIWIDGIETMMGLEVKNPKGLYEYLKSYSFLQTITNRHNVFNGPILEPVRKIVESLS